MAARKESPQSPSDRGVAGPEQDSRPTSYRQEMKGKVVVAKKKRPIKK